MYKRNNEKTLIFNIDFEIAYNKTEIFGYVSKEKRVWRKMQNMDQGLLDFNEFF